ncbi:hypothetical protein [Methylobacterium iners]|uniref:Uncharacterized protein n=1 Tax=Methylobacterium iners TaxID=418707 RepID=A0ABQ4RYM5_9HYPH|nr:hypothetical protein [Methylobacterium iners]GJD95686.1 hypothetical protein OCOJLMKI_2900 [Methylobacterium iners]
MRHVLRPGRLPHQRLMHRPPPRRDEAKRPPIRMSDLILAVLGVTLLGGFALTAAFALAAGWTVS